MKFLTRTGIISLMMALALFGAVAGYSIYTLVYAQPFILCGSNDLDFEGDCAPDVPGTGNDIVAIGPNPVDVDGAEGNDQIYNGAIQTELECLTNGDAPSAEDALTMTGGGDDDLLVDNDNGNTLDGGEGNDTLIANGGCDSLIGGDGDDFLSGGAGHDTFAEGEGNDIVIGGPGNDSDPDNVLNAQDAVGDDIFIINAGDVPSGQTERWLCDGSGDPAAQNNLVIFLGFGTTVIVDQDADPENGFQVQDPVTGGIYEFNHPDDGEDDLDGDDTNGLQPGCDNIIGL